MALAAHHPEYHGLGVASKCFCFHGIMQAGMKDENK